MNALFRLIRPKQWIKNFFVFLPLFFGGNLLDGRSLLASIITFVAFCFAASSIYCFNDLVDVEADRRHPVKCKRPIAAGLQWRPSVSFYSPEETLLPSLIGRGWVLEPSSSSIGY